MDIPICLESSCVVSYSCPEQATVCAKYNRRGIFHRLKTALWAVYVERGAILNYQSQTTVYLLIMSNDWDDCHSHHRITLIPHSSFAFRPELICDHLSLGHVLRSQLKSLETFCSSRDPHICVGGLIPIPLFPKDSSDLSKTYRLATPSGGECTGPGDYVGFNTGNREKLSCSQAEPGQASCLAVA